MKKGVNLDYLSTIIGTPHLRHNESKKYWFYIVPTSIRRSGEMRVTNKQIEKAIKKSTKYVVL